VNAVPQQILIRAIERPVFDNASLGNFGAWANENANALARYWRDQGVALGITKEDDEEFTFWLRVQHDIEVSAQRRARLPHGASL